MRYLVATCAFLTCLVAAAAQDGPQRAPEAGRSAPATGVTVQGVGTAKLPADTLEHRTVLVIGGARLAEVKQEYDRVTGRLQTALEQLGMSGVTHELRGATIVSMTEAQFRRRQQRAMEWGEEPPSHKCEIKDHVTVRATLDGLTPKEVRDLVVGVMEVATELDLQDPTDDKYRFDPWGRPVRVELPEGWTPGLSFLLRDPSALHAAAVKAALEDARAKADVQAGVVGVGLGRVLDVETISGGAVSPGKVRDVSHRVALRVRYDLAGN
jgi:uncharacterized protein YggE